MTKTSEIPVELLLAYHAGELAPAKAAALAQRIAQDAEATATLAAWAAQDAALARLGAPIAAEPVPERLLAVLRRAEDLCTPPDQPLSPGLPDVPWGRLAASVALLGLGLASGWFLRGAEGPIPPVAGAQSLALAALSAHDTYVVEVAHPVEVAASEGAHLTGWISRRLGHEIRPPDFLAQGFVLLGGRILPSAPSPEGRAEGTAPAALFMYENGLGQRLTLYVAPQGPGVETAFRFHEAGETRSFYWTDRDLSYAIVGDIDRETLRAMATLAYQQLI